SGAAGRSGGGAVARIENLADDALPKPTQVITTFAGMKSLTVQTGAGNDTAVVLNAPSGEGTSLILDSRAGADAVTLNAVANETTVRLGDDADQLLSRAATAGATLKVYAGAGDDLLNIQQAGANVTLNGEDGDDLFDVAGAFLPDGVSVTV